MKKLLFSLILLISILFPVHLCGASDIDPILLNEPNDKVFGCKNDIFIELTQQPTLGRVASGRTAPGYFVVIQAEILFLLEEPWQGIDKNSFSLMLTDSEGNSTYYPLNYAISMMSNQKVSWDVFSAEYKFTDLKHTNLIFDVTPYTSEGWTLVFRPTERGAESVYCEITIPLTEDVKPLLR